MTDLDPHREFKNRLYGQFAPHRQGSANSQSSIAS